MNLFSRKSRRNFKKSVLKEMSGDCPNPGRGWYRVYAMDAAAGAPIAEWKYSMKPEQPPASDVSFKAGATQTGDGVQRQEEAAETLALLLVDIGAFAGGELPDEALSNIRNACLFFQREQKELLLRFTYDREGRCMEKEPTELARIVRHMEQLAPVFAEFGDMIFCIQGLFVGNWGEMHGSRFLTGAALGTLWHQIYRLSPESCFFAVRRPEQWKLVTGIHGAAPEKELRTLRLGLFNDGLLGSRTDLGTYKEEERDNAIRFQDRLCCYVPNGGECVGEDACGDIEQAVDYFRRIHISYLNCVYDERVLQRWKNSTYCGENGYAYIGKRLGYRFVLTDACLLDEEMNQKMQIEVENRGFSTIYEACELSLHCGGKVVRSDAQADLRTLLPNGRMQLQFAIPDDWSGQVAFCVVRRRDGRCIRLANEGAGEEFVVGVIKRNE